MAAEKEMHLHAHIAREGQNENFREIFNVVGSIACQPHVTVPGVPIIVSPWENSQGSIHHLSLLGWSICSSLAPAATVFASVVFTKEFCFEGWKCRFALSCIC